MEFQAGIEVKLTVCCWCKAECGLLAYVKDGVLLQLEEDPDWPIKCYPPTAGCVRRKAAVEYFYHPGRLNYPLKRVGEREGHAEGLPEAKKNCFYGGGEAAAIKTNFLFPSPPPPGGWREGAEKRPRRGLSKHLPEWERERGRGVRAASGNFSACKKW